MYFTPLFINLHALKTNNSAIHRGKVLQEVVKRSDLNIAQVAKKARYSRASYYNHIDDPELPFEILERYGKVIAYDFSRDFPEMVKYSGFTETGKEYLTHEQACRERDHWRDKYYDLLERFNELLLEKLNRQQNNRQ